MGNKICMDLGAEYEYKKGYCVNSVVLGKVRDMKEEDRVELLLLMEDYHEETQKNRRHRPSIDSHFYHRYSETLKNTCFFCFSHKKLHKFV